MRWNVLAIVPLTFLAAAAAPPEDCLSPPSAVQTPPIFLDEASQPVVGGRLDETATGCEHALPIPDRNDILQSHSDDVLHGLPQTDSLRRIDEPRQPPMFQ